MQFRLADGSALRLAFIVLLKLDKEGTWRSSSTLLPDGIDEGLLRSSV